MQARWRRAHLRHCDVVLRHGSVLLTAVAIAEAVEAGFVVERVHQGRRVRPEGYEATARRLSPGQIDSGLRPLMARAKRQDALRGPVKLLLHPIGPYQTGLPDHSVHTTGPLECPELSWSCLLHGLHLQLLQRIYPQGHCHIRKLLLERPELSGTPKHLCQDCQRPRRVYRAVLLQQSGCVVHQKRGPCTRLHWIAGVVLPQASGASKFQAKDLYIDLWQVVEGVEHMLAVALCHDHQAQPGNAPSSSRHRP
mmetsp:Transcript_16777/g.46175  ORF Transcript_16777/g.46175 Transcript_16777/m.46175 type:complete len:252 (+) Transcript_16777:80-835(+)